jgi:tetratricopeptide (TPR) repeat protein
VILIGVGGSLAVFQLGILPQRFQSIFKAESFGFRIKYYRSSWHLFLQNPILGSGLWSYRKNVYGAQAAIYQSDPDYFTNFKKPQPRRVHNDYLEILNDGGLVAAAVLLILLLTVLLHGKRTISDKQLDLHTRILALSALSAVLGILIVALSFFPLRLPSTLAMISVQLGMIEALYLRRGKYLVPLPVKRHPLVYLLLPILCVIIGGLWWALVYNPLRGEIHFDKYTQALSRKDMPLAESQLVRAISFSPDNTLYCAHAATLYLDYFRNYRKAGEFINRVLSSFNGDVTLWNLYYIRGEISTRTGHLTEAQGHFEKALFYYPHYKPAQHKLDKINRILETHDQLIIKLK